MVSLFYCGMYIVYILYSVRLDKYYIGYTNDMERRLQEHNRRKGKFTDRGIPWNLVYKEEYEQKEDAVRRELYLKNQKSRNFIEALLKHAQLVEHPDLSGVVLGSNPS